MSPEVTKETVKMSWFNTGEDANKKMEEEEERRAKARANILYRFWMPAGAETHITFVDEEKSEFGYDMPFTFMEHQLQLNCSWKNWFTCLKGMQDAEGNKIECPLCKGGDQPYLAGAYTIIDHSEWKDRTGKLHKDERKLYIVKSKVQKVLRKAAAKKEGLRGWRVEVNRTDDKSPNTGDQFDFEDRAKLKAEIKAPNYLEIFAPKTVEDLMKIVGDVQAESEEPIRF